MLSPKMNLGLVQPCLLHDVLDVAGSEHEVGLAGEHGTLEARDTLVWEAWWHGGCFRAWLLAALPLLGKLGSCRPPCRAAGCCRVVTLPRGGWDLGMLGKSCFWQVTLLLSNSGFGYFSKSCFWKVMLLHQSALRRRRERVGRRGRDVDHLGQRQQAHV